MFAQLSWKNQLNGTLDFPAAQGVFLVVSDQFAGLHCDAVETVVDEGVHNAHRFL
jgi:hypothetical protein